MSSKHTLQQTADYRIRQRADGYAVYDKHSRFRVICPTEAEAQEYINQHSARSNRVAAIKEQTQ